MKGLGELFDEAEGQAARAAGDAQLGEDRLGAVHTTVRRAHARRSALQASLAAVAVVVLGAGVAYGFWQTEEPPALDVPLSPSPSSTPICVRLSRQPTSGRCATSCWPSRAIASAFSMSVGPGP